MTVARTLVSPVVYVFAKTIRSHRLYEMAARMDPMNLRAVAFLTGGRQLEIQKFAIAAHFIAAEDAHNKGVVSTFFSKAQGQLLQDLFALLASAGKQNGTFVEVGVGTGKYLSNTYMLENELGWQGILVEPNRSSHEGIRACRKSYLDSRAATSTSGQTLEFEEVKGSGEFSRLAGSKGHNFDGFQIERYEVSTVTLNDIFEDKEMPPEIDFISIDTEGSELDVLKGIDFNRYSFTALAIEHNYDDRKLASICALLKRHGYYQVFPEISGFDVWFVHPSCYLGELSWVSKKY